MKTKNKCRGKKGELTTQQLVILIVLIVSFGIILLFFWQLNLRGETDKEICHNSVVMKQTKYIGNFFRLKCTTQKYCFALGNGDCSNAGLIDAKKVSISSTNTKKDIIKNIAELSADCWWMFGEGKIDWSNKNDCAICSKINFNDNLKNKNIEITYNEYFNWLENNKVPNTQLTYLQYFGQSFITFSNDQSIRQSVLTYINPNINNDYAILTYDYKNAIYPPIIVLDKSDSYNDCDKIVTLS